MREHVPEAGKAQLAGNSVGTDRGFLARDMPELEQHLHYRIVDVSSIKELARRWYPRVYFNSPKKTGNHRALGDIRDSIAELRYYREAIFVPQPGPDSETARTLAARIEAEERPRRGARGLLTSGDLALGPFGARGERLCRAPPDPCMLGGASAARDPGEPMGPVTGRGTWWA